MDDRLYPISLAEITRWQQRHGTTPAEARVRFVQFVVLESIATSSMQRQLAFKGGNALRFAYRNPRSTTDLDFSATQDFPDDKHHIRTQLNDALKQRWAQFGIRTQCQSINRNPKVATATFPTYQLKISYAFPTDRQFSDFESQTNLPSVVDVEISIGEVICETHPKTLTPQSISPLCVCSSEDIIAEKLRSLLQQPIRNRQRPQDVLDIAMMLTNSPSPLDEHKISQFLQTKAVARSIEPKQSSFNDDIRSRAAVDYDKLLNDAGDSFIPFERAWQLVLELVKRLTIPA